MSDYQQAFFTVPYRIFQLEGITISFLRFYETVFQFWHHDKPCYLNNESLKQRTGINSSSTIKLAFEFFEKHKEMRRETRNGKRYIVQPTRLLEIDESILDEKLVDTLSINRDPPSRQIETPPLDKSRHNNNNNNNNNNNKNSCASKSNAHERFDDFWKSYPKKKDKVRCKKTWNKHKLYNIADKIIEDVSKRLAQDAHWQDAQYIPYPNTYLNDQGWDNDITTIQPEKSKKTTVINTNEPDKSAYLVINGKEYASFDDYRNESNKRDREYNERMSVSY